MGHILPLYTCICMFSVFVSVSSPRVVQAWAVGPWARGPTVWSTWSYSASSGPPSASSLQAGSTAYLAWRGTSRATKQAQCKFFFFFPLLNLRPISQTTPKIMSWKKEAVDFLFLLGSSFIFTFFYFLCSL